MRVRICATKIINYLGSAHLLKTRNYFNSIDPFTIRTLLDIDFHIFLFSNKYHNCDRKGIAHLTVITTLDIA